MRNFFFRNSGVFHILSHWNVQGCWDSWYPWWEARNSRYWIEEVFMTLEFRWVLTISEISILQNVPHIITSSRWIESWKAIQQKRVNPIGLRFRCPTTKSQSLNKFQQQTSQSSNGKNAFSSWTCSSFKHCCLCLSCHYSIIATAAAVQRVHKIYFVAVIVM